MFKNWQSMNIMRGSKKRREGEKERMLRKEAMEYRRMRGRR